EVGYLNTTGHRNVFIGSEAGWANETGLYNVFIGSEAGFANETGNNNVFIGNETGLSNQGGFANVYLGDGAGRLGKFASWNVFVGYQSGFNTSGTHNVFLGHTSGYSNTTGFSNNFIGQGAGYSNTTGTNNIFIGNDAGRENLSSSGNIFMGRSAGYHSTEHGNTIIGHTAGEFLETGSNNTFLGVHSGQERTGGGNNLILGSYANYKGGSGNDNTIIGALAGGEATGYRNVLLGFQAGYNEKGNDKLYIANSNTTTPLIWGDFNLKQLRFNATAVGINAAPSTTQTLLVEDIRASNDSPAIVGKHDVTSNWGVGVKGIGGYKGVEGIATFEGEGTRYGVYAQASGGTTNYAGYFVGDVRVTGSFVNPSDLNLKQNIKPIANAVQKIMQLNGVYFEWKPTTRFSAPDKDGKYSDGEEVSKETQVGVIAQEVEKVFPEIVLTDERGIKSVDYTKLTPLLIQAIKEQQQTITNQNEVIEVLKSQNEQIMQRLQQIEEQLNK
ncbi:MAG: tail fiber domain-containing protein, partial [Bacteroidales bacterium]|nr:tail fiber domain-containing protein [Bacteroidales bacterium]